MVHKCISKVIASLLLILYILYAVESLNNGHFGTNINSSVCPLYRGCPLLRDSNRIILIGGIKFGDLVLSVVERYLIQCPFLGVSIERLYYFIYEVSEPYSPLVYISIVVLERLGRNGSHIYKFSIQDSSVIKKKG